MIRCVIVCVRFKENASRDAQILSLSLGSLPFLSTYGLCFLDPTTTLRASTSRGIGQTAINFIERLVEHFTYSLRWLLACRVLHPVLPPSPKALVTRTMERPGRVQLLAVAISN